VVRSDDNIEHHLVSIALRQTDFYLYEKTVPNYLIFKRKQFQQQQLLDRVLHVRHLLVLGIWIVLNINRTKCLRKRGLHSFRTVIHHTYIQIYDSLVWKCVSLQIKDQSWQHMSQFKIFINVHNKGWPPRPMTRHCYNNDIILIYWHTLHIIEYNK
jgi:hypothetical protein